MKIRLTALMFVAMSAAADPLDSQSGTTPDASRSTATDSSWTQSRDTGVAATDDDSSDDSWSANSNGLNYETGEVCVTRGAGGVCLESTDD
jgi:hypothetical protein